MRLPPRYIFGIIPNTSFSLGHTLSLLQRSGLAVYSARGQHAAVGCHYVLLFSPSRSTAASYQLLVPEPGLPLYGDYILT